MAEFKQNHVAWTEGMFLRPQHFQQLDASADARLTHHLHALNPFHFGIQEMRLDTEALAGFQIKIQRLRAVLPTGTIVEYPGSARVEPIKFDPGREQLRVYLGVRYPDPDSPNAVPEESKVRNAPFVLRETEVHDFTRPDSTTSIEILRPNVRLFVSGDEPELAIYDSIEIARVHATGDPSNPFAVTETYAPPLLSIRAWKPLAQRIEELLEQMAGKVRVVAGNRQSLTALDLPRMLTWYTLARLTPVLSHLMATEGTHPYPVYTTLLEAVAALGAMGRAEGVLRPPAYDHNDLYHCFGLLIQNIHDELETEFRDRSVEIPLPFSGRHRSYSTEALTIELASSKNAFYLAVKHAQVDSESLVKLVSQEAKAGAIKNVGFLVNMSLRGLKIEALPAAPADVQPRPGFHFFRIDPKSDRDQWNEVVSEGTFGLHLGKLEGADVRLFVVPAE